MFVSIRQIVSRKQIVTGTRQGFSNVVVLSLCCNTGSAQRRLKSPGVFLSLFAFGRQFDVCLQTCGDFLCTSTSIAMKQPETQPKGTKPLTPASTTEKQKPA